jgi:hypothetical protein
MQRRIGDNLPKCKFEKLLVSYPRRVEAVIVAKGAEY